MRMTLLLTCVIWIGPEIRGGAITREEVMWWRVSDVSAGEAGRQRLITLWWRCERVTVVGDEVVASVDVVEADSDQTMEPFLTLLSVLASLLVVEVDE
jgi:hypothetical protein